MPEPKPPIAVDQDRRGARRQRTLLKAKVIFNGGHSSFEGLLRNLSETGARLEFGGFAPVPGRFELRCDGTVQWAEVAWRQNRAVGLRFV